MNVLYFQLLLNTNCKYKNMSLKQILPILAGFLFLVACSGNTDRPIKESVSAFLNENESIIAFGSLNYSQILDKAEYKKIDKLGKLIEERLSDALNPKSPIYFAMEGPFDRKGNPRSTFVFLDVQNKDTLEDRLASSGLFIEEAGEMKYSVNDDLSIGIKGNLAIVVIKNEDYNGKLLLESAFNKAKGEVAVGKMDELLSKNNDITLNANLENLYGTSNTSLSKLSKPKQKELTEMVKDSYVHATLDFEKGKMVFKTENLFSTVLQKRMFFKDDANASVLSNLGKGKARIGIAASIDMKKAESFIDDFAADFKEKMINSDTKSALAVMLLGDGPLNKVFSGVAGLVLVGEPQMMGFVPELNFTVGIGKEGKPLFELWAASKSGGRFIYTITDKNLVGFSPSAGAGMSSLVIPSCGKEFGKKGISGFIDFQGLDVESFYLHGAYKSINVVKNITFKVDNKGSEIVINTTNPNQNILKQIIDLNTQDLKDMMGNMAI